MDKDEGLLVITLILVVLSANLIFIDSPSFIVSLNTLVQQGIPESYAIIFSFEMAFGFLILTGVIWFLANVKRKREM